VAIRQGGDGPIGFVLEYDSVRVDPEVERDGGEEVANADLAAVDFRALAVCSTDDLPSLDAAPREQERGGARPVIAAWLPDSRRGVFIVADLGRAAELARNHDEDAPIEAAGVDILDERGDSAIEVLAADFHRIKDMVIDGMIIPVADAAAEWTVERGGDEIDSGFDEPAGQQAALTPGIAAVPIAQSGVFEGEIERPPRGG
jgi:hypothetical protein